MNELIRINSDSDRPTVSGRELHEALEVNSNYSTWFKRMCEYGFTEGKDVVTAHKNVIRADGAIMSQTQADRTLITINMAKEMCILREIESRLQKKQHFMYIAQSIFQKCRFCTKIKYFSKKFYSVFLLKSILYGLLCKITKKVVQKVVKTRIFCMKLKAVCKKRSFMYIAQSIFQKYRFCTKIK